MVRLHDPVHQLKGIGKVASEKLSELGIETVEQLLFTFPARHEDFTQRDLREVGHGEKVTVEGRAEQEPTLFFSGRGRSRLQLVLRVGPHVIRTTFFNQHYLKDRIRVGDTVTVSGKWDKGRQSITVQKFFHGVQNEPNAFEPVYRLKGKFHQKTFRTFIGTALEALEEPLPERLPRSILESEQLLSIDRAVRAIHLPGDAEEHDRALERFIYEELFLFQLKMMAMKQKRKSGETGRVIDYDVEALRQFIGTFPFEMTNAQKRVVNEICIDLKQPYRMNRLLQGDVGSGKTAVAATGIFAAWTAGVQSAFLAPTEILAEQHATTLAEWLEPFGLRVAFLAGSTKTKARRDMLERLATGEVDVLVGTHALLQPDVTFSNLGFVVTDEQHRFGVEQRRILREKGNDPDVLFMTATPIPRTLAITAFGEMDVSIIDELPAGRKEIETYWLTEQSLVPLLRRMERELVEGRQVYVICPLIEESDALDVQNALDVHAQLEQFYRGRHTVGLMHGRLPASEKDEVMARFASGEVDVLVSTTVVEVGVNVPNATFMIIYDATRFGLAQLHQLRGRVGRGEHQSYCVLLADPKNEEGQERMRSMVETNDGFVIAEKDMQLRGSGDLFGTKQSGMPEFQFADLQEHVALLSKAQQQAIQLLNDSTFWEAEESAQLRHYLKETGALSDERID